MERILDLGAGWEWPRVGSGDEAASVGGAMGHLAYASGGEVVVKSPGMS